MPAAAQCLPTAEQVADDRGVALSLHQCDGCGLVQLDTSPVPYWREVIRATGLSPSMRSFRLAQLTAWVRDHHLAGRKVLEVGCGRGEYLALLAETGAEAQGIEYGTDSVAACTAAGMRVERGFIEGPGFTVEGSPFAAFTMFNVLEHLPSPGRVLAGISAQLADDAVGLVEVPNFDMILRQGLFAEFIADHLLYFTQSTLVRMLETSGFEVRSCTPVWHDYILSAVVAKRQRLDVSRLVAGQHAAAAAFARFLAGFGDRGVAVWGAGHQALALLSLMGISDRIRYVVDSAPFKQGRFTPATHVPIVAPERLDQCDVAAVIVLAASYTEEVVGLIRSRYAGRFTVASMTDGGLKVVLNGTGNQIH
jgi:2-polyprenyl-3-methyl-5-hydroxy-6-metoxy-1,4-benzoquinol methylase